ncbi:hypothetical protein SAMN05192534_12389 [Alteribacillus persepolensis]|uniref:TrbC/VIRB2 family protein n=1 Tax=Alteribacillus persepolensis TaxID=568899 RepID=A0A1G8ICK7_9BACI|nr:hypothetical protein [Alteribacillus persepolensis]SDI16626.1 hypothetical protein SAMN05192534_12389 [Alteribacillus persepolensis]
MKTKTVGTISEFMNPQPKAKRKVSSVTVPLLLAGGATPAMAQEPHAVTVSVNGAIKEKIVGSFDPLVELITHLSYPVATVMVTGGALMVMIGLKEKGYSTIQTASIGFILVQMAPLLLELLFGIGEAV